MCKTEQVGVHTNLPTHLLLVAMVVVHSSSTGQDRVLRESQMVRYLFLARLCCWIQLIVRSWPHSPWPHVLGHTLQGCAPVQRITRPAQSGKTSRSKSACVPPSTSKGEAKAPVGGKMIRFASTSRGYVRSDSILRHTSRYSPSILCWSAERALSGLAVAISAAEAGSTLA